MNMYKNNSAEEKKLDTVAAVVVTYNRKKLLSECLQSLTMQSRSVEKIYVIDNASTDGTSEMLSKSGFLVNPQVEYIHLSKNTGGAGGFYEGVKRAHEAGYDWVWLMDDDAEPMIDTLEMLLTMCEDKKIKAICPLIMGEANVPQSYHHKIIQNDYKDRSALQGVIIDDLEDGLIKIDANAFVGPLINCKIVGEVGYPNRNLFIWGDDTEYTIRISKKTNLYLCTKALIHHKDGNYAAQKELPESQHWKFYYGIRNRLWLVRDHCGSLMTAKICVRSVLSLLSPKITWRLRKIKFRAVRDGLLVRRSTYGNYN